MSVVGCSGSGKSTVARRLSDVLGVSHIELDALHWGLDWSPATPEELTLVGSPYAPRCVTTSGRPDCSTGSAGFQRGFIKA
ncbi:MAG: hypothetical protein ACRDTU_22510 [Micromonosporaceae bacterium]